MTDEDEVRDLERVVKRIRKAIRVHVHPLLKGKGPEVQSAVLADLTATYLAGIAPPLRPEMRAMFIKLVDELVPENERELFGDVGHPFMKGGAS